VAVWVVALIPATFPHELFADFHNCQCWCWLYIIYYSFKNRVKSVVQTFFSIFYFSWINPTRKYKCGFIGFRIKSFTIAGFVSVSGRLGCIPVGSWTNSMLEPVSISFFTLNHRLSSWEEPSWKNSRHFRVTCNVCRTTCPWKVRTRTAITMKFYVFGEAFDVLSFCCKYLWLWFRVWM
jgi:hypothetical protein